MKNCGFGIADWGMNSMHWRLQSADYRFNESLTRDFKEWSQRKKLKSMRQSRFHKSAIGNPQSAMDFGQSAIGNPQSAIKSLFVVLAFLIYSSTNLVASETAGTTYPFLDLQVTPRTQSLGGTSAAWGGDASAVLGNPAGLAKVMVSEVSLMQTQPIFDSNYYLATAVLDGGWGLAWSQQTMTDISLSSSTSATVTSDVMPDGTSTYLADAVTIAKGFSINEDLSLGFSVAGFYQDFSNISYGKGYGGSLSVGSLWDISESSKNSQFKVGFVLKDILNISRWNTGTWEMASPSARLGLFGELQPWWDLTLETRKNILSAAPLTLHVGSEVRILDLAAIRAGYDDGVLTAGAGLMVGPLKVDASYEAQSESTYGERVKVGAGLVF